MALSGRRESRRWRSASFAARVDRLVGVADVVMRFVAAAQPLEDADGLFDGRLLDGDLLQPARQRRGRFSMCLNSSNVVEPTTRRSPAVRTGLISVARSSVPPVVAPAPTVAWISSMKRIGFRPLGERLNHRLEALLEIAAEAGAGEQRRRVERVDLGAGQQRRHVGFEQPRREAFGHRRLADARIADEHRIVLAPAAEDLERPLQLDRAPDERIEQSGAGAGGEVGGVGAERVARRSRALRCRRLRWPLATRCPPPRASSAPW